MEMSAVDSIAQGRVWSGVEALNNGLVDELGGLQDAIAKAAELAEISDYGVKELPKFDSDFEKLMGDLGGVYFKSKTEDYLKESLGEEVYQQFSNIRNIQQQKGIQARMPFELTIK
jgi:protease-4